MAIIEITHTGDRRLAPYLSLTDAQLRNRLDPASGVFIAESPKVILTALKAGYKPVSLLCERRHIEGDAAEIIRLLGPETDIFTADREVLAALTGYTLTRGVLCAMRRPSPLSVGDLPSDGRQRVAVLEDVVDSTNVGAIFRSAAALGIDAVVVNRGTCDPLNRRVVRVSMGSVFLVPWALADNPAAELRAKGFRSVAMALRRDSVALDSPSLKSEPRLAIIFGSEGYGLADTTLNAVDYVAKIPMSHGVDSLNVAASAAIAFWELCK